MLDNRIKLSIKLCEVTKSFLSANSDHPLIHGLLNFILGNESDGHVTIQL